LIIPPQEQVGRRSRSKAAMMLSNEFDIILNFQKWSDVAYPLSTITWQHNKVAFSKTGSATWPLSLWFWSTKLIGISILSFRVILPEGFRVLVGCHFGIQYLT